MTDAVTDGTAATQTAAPHVAVVGAGISGLAAAYRLRSEVPGLRVTVLEGAVQVGGKLRVSDVAGVPVDEGAEALLNRRHEAVDLAREVGLGDALTHPATTSPAVWTRGAVRPLPPTLMGIPTDLAALTRSGIVTRSGVLRARLDHALPPTDIGADIGVGRLVARRLGAQVNDRLLEPLLGGVYAGHARDLSLRAAVPQISALVDRGRSLLAAAAASRAETMGDTTPVFAGIRGGVGRLPAAVAAACEASGTQVRTGTVVRELVRRDRGWTLVTGPTRAEETLDVDAVVLAVPAAPAARLLEPHAAQTAARLGQVDYASVAVVTFAFDRASAGAGSGFSGFSGSGFLVPPVDRRSVKAATYSSNKWGWLAEADESLAVVRTSLGRYGDERDLQRDDADLAGVALADLRAATGVAGTPVGTRVTRWGGGLPQYTVGHAERVAQIREGVAALPGVAVCGAAYDGLGIPACVASAYSAVTQVVRGLRRQGRIPV